MTSYSDDKGDAKETDTEDDARRHTRAMAAAVIRGVEDDGEAGGAQDEDDAATVDVESVLPGRVPEEFNPP